MTQTTTCAGTNPDADIIEKLTDAIADVCDRERELHKRREAMCSELAALLCPFTEGERIRIPRSAYADGHAEGIIRAIWFDSHYGYQLYLSYDDERQGSLSAYMNVELEPCNDKVPALPATMRDGCLRLLRDARDFF